MERWAGPVAADCAGNCAFPGLRLWPGWGTVSQAWSVITGKVLTNFSCLWFSLAILWELNQMTLSIVPPGSWMFKPFSSVVLCVWRPGDSCVHNDSAESMCSFHYFPWRHRHSQSPLLLSSMFWESLQALCSSFWAEAAWTQFTRMKDKLLPCRSGQAVDTMELRGQDSFSAPLYPFHSACWLSALFVHTGVTLALYSHGKSCCHVLRTGLSWIGDKGRGHYLQPLDFYSPL